MKKYFVLSALMMAGNIAHLNGDGNRDDYQIAKAVVALFGAGAVKTAGDYVSENKVIHDVSESVGINPRDVGKVGALSCGLFALSIFSNDDYKKSFREMAWRGPIVGAGMAISFTKTFQKIARNVPLIGEFISCEDKECPGVCSKCMLTKSLVGYGLGRTFNVGIDKYLVKKGQ